MKRSIAIVALMIAAAACGSVRDEGGTGGVPLLTPDEAAGRSGDVSIQGFFWARPDQGIALLCKEELGGSPRECGEPSIALVGVDIPILAGVSFEQNVFWAPDVRVRGTLDDGTLTATDVELNAHNDSNGLSFRLLVPIEVPRAGVMWTGILTNSGRSTVSLRFPSGQSADVLLSDPETGELVYAWSDGQSFTAAVREEELAPGETIRFVLTDEGFGLDSGVYDLQALMTGSPAPGSVIGRVVVP